MRTILVSLLVILAACARSTRTEPRASAPIAPPTISITERPRHVVEDANRQVVQLCQREEARIDLITRAQAIRAGSGRLCERGDPQACINTTLFEMCGIAGARNLTRALAAAQRGCALTSTADEVGANCQAILPLILALGVNPEPGERVLEQACLDSGRVEACESLSWSEGVEIFRKRDPDRLDRVARRGCALRGPVSCRAVAVALGDRGAAEEALSFIEQACAAGDAESCSEAADRRLGMPRVEIGRVCSLYQRGCDLEDADACGRLSVCYAKGDAFPVDGKRAVEFAERACLAKAAHGCKLLGIYYVNGDLVNQDAAKARHYLRLACDLDNTEACALLGRLP